MMAPPVCEHDLSGQQIMLYHFGDLSGPYAFITTPALAGFEDAVAYFNAQGGICGAEIVSEYRDTQARGAAAQAAWDEFRDRGDAYVMFTYLTEDSELLRQQAAEQQIPLIVPTPSTLALYGENADSPGWVFAATPLYQDQLGAFCDYISANWAQYGIEGDPVIGHISWLGAFGQASDTEESRAYCASKGVGYSKSAYYLPGIPDISTQVTSVMEAGANILYTTSLATGPAQLAGTVTAMGIRDQVVLAGPNWVLDTSVVNLGGEAVAGMIGQLPYHWWDDVEHPGVQVVNNYWVENRLADNPESALQVRNIAYLLSWTTVAWFQEFMTLATNAAGGLENLSGTAVYEVLTSGQSFNPLGGLISLSYGPEQRAPNQTRMGTIEFVATQGGQIAQVRPLTDWLTTPDLIPGGADVPAN
jgi:ABC-type branched-subunit amino acid transport system substrate-binding protein